MNTNPNRNNPNDTAAVPVGGTAAPRGFNYLWLLPLLLIPLLYLGFCSHRGPDRTVDNPPATSDTPAAVDTAPAVNPTATAPAVNTVTAAPAANTALLNPFTAVATGPDMGKAVVNFDVNTTAPNAAAAATLGAVAAYLQANPAARVSLTGYTDNTGTAAVNRDLTQKRVDNVKSALTGAGVDASRIATANFGEAYPITDNASPQAREMNRRVEVTLAK